jgi:hypothetical protein
MKVSFVFCAGVCGAARTNLTFSFSGHKNEVNKGDTDLTETDCIRGDNANIYRFAFFFAPLWASILFCIVAMILVHKTMKKSEATYKKFKYSQTNKKRRKGSVEVKRQSIRYSFAFFFVWTFPTIARVVQFFDEVHPILVVLSGTTIGMQGFFNALIYFRPRYAKCVKHKSWYRRVWALVHSTLFFCCYNEDYTKDNLDYVGERESTARESTTTASTLLGFTKRDVVSTQVAQLDVGSTQRDMGCTRQIEEDSGERDEEKQEEEVDEWHPNGEDGPIQATPTPTDSRESTATASTQLGSTKRDVVSTQVAVLDVGSTQRDVGCTRQIEEDSGERDEEKQEEEANEWHSNGEDGPIQATGDRESTARDSTATASTQLGSTKRDVVSTQVAQLDVGSTQRDMGCTRQIEEDSGERDEEKQEEEADEWHSNGEDGPIQATPTPTYSCEVGK